MRSRICRSLMMTLQFILLLDICLFTSLMAQNSVVIDETDRVPISETHRPPIPSESDAGRTDPNLRMRQMVLVVAPSLRAGHATSVVPQLLSVGPTDLQSWRSKGGSAHIGRADQPLLTVTSWLHSHGLLIRPARDGHAAIRFSGTVAQVEEAFRVEIHNFVIDGKTYYANVNSPSIPRALSPSIRAVKSLDDFSMDSGNSPAGSPEVVLYNFTGTVLDPAFGGVRDSAGNLYGTTSGGGSAGLGSVFKLDSAGRETVLYSFTGTNADDSPNGGLIMDSVGNLYGTTSSGSTFLCVGDGECGTVFKLDTNGHESVLYSFTGTNGDGGNPNGGLIRDSGGNLYGTTSYGGNGACPGLFAGQRGCGTVFKLDITGHESVLYSFAGYDGDGAVPNGGLIMDSAGNLYGTTGIGGDPSCESGDGCGTVFKLDITGHETVFDVASPNGGLIMDSVGNLYGTTSSGETWFCVDLGECGTVFKLDTNGHESVLYSFTGTNGDGGNPNGGLIMDNAGNLYGTTSYGGSAGGGTMFKLTASGKESVLYGFADDNGDGASPNGGLIMDSAGNLYGTTGGGGPGLCVGPGYQIQLGCGTVFKLDTNGHESVLYSFTGANGDGGIPNGGLIMDSARNLYGTTSYGGNGGCQCGTVFKLDTNGHESVLYSFTEANGDGGIPNGGLIMDSVGNLYGTTSSGGTWPCVGGGCGTVFKLDTNGHESVLYSFTGTNGDGANPNGGVIMDSAGNLYGTTMYGGNGACQGVGAVPAGCGTVFKLSTTGNETILHSFTGTNGDGIFPNGGLIMDTADNLYGTTSVGGNLKACDVGAPPPGCGTVFKLGIAGHETVLYSFPGTYLAAGPNGGLVMDSAGNLYGTTSGSVFKLNTNGNEVVLSGSIAPNGGLIMDSMGKSLYGTTSSGGPAGVGTVFELGVTPDFSLQASVVSPASVVAGESGKSNITISSLNGLEGTVNLTCSVSPNPTGAPTCTVSPASVTLAANSTASSTLMIDTTGASASATSPAWERGTRLLYGVWLLIPAMVLVGNISLGSKRRRGFGLLLGVLLVSWVASLLGCGGNGGGSSKSQVTPAGNYMITVTASSGSSITHSTTVTLSVQ